MIGLMKSNGGSTTNGLNKNNNQKAYMFTKAANNSNSSGLINSAEKRTQNSPGFLNKKKNFTTR